MNFSPDDPKITAYALGELPPLEAKAVERALQNSPELRAAVEEIRLTAELLKTEFAGEPVATLSKNQKDAVIAAIPADNIISLPNRRFWRTAGLSAIAASILCVVAWQMSLPEKKPFSVAQTESEVASKPADDSSQPPASVASPTVALAELPKEEAAQEKFRVEPEARTLADKQSASAPEKRKAVETAVKLEQNRVAAKKDFESFYATPQGPVGAASDARQNELAKTFTAQQSEPAAAMASAPVQSTPAPASPGADVPTQSFSGYAYGVDVSGGAADSVLPSGNKNGQLAGRTIATRSLRAESSSLSRDASVEVKQAWSKQPERLARSDRRWYYDESDLKREREFNDYTARYPKYKENDFESVTENPLSTFSIDVDTASYANVRRFLNEDRMPPKDAVRIEEMINYFSYSYPQPKGDEPFSVNMEVAGCPWQPEHRLLRVGIKGKEMAQNKRPPSNFVFLIDVSGSMSPQERLPLIKQSLRMLVKQMSENDRIAIVVYASSSGVVLESTSAVNKEKILEALDRLEAGGSTNGGQGIQRAYALAEEHFIKGGVNRVILCTDGDFNVGITNQDELIQLIQRKAKGGVFLSVLGVGTDNYKDALMQKLADKGNGNYHYLDSVEEAHKVLIKQMNGTLVTIAKDVKIQIEFNPAQVSSYRLVGYEKRILAAEDFNNDKKDAGEIGAGHTVTALYELVPAGSERTQTVAAVDELKYQRKVAAPAAKASREIVEGSKDLLTLKLRYKKPDGDKSVLREHTLVDQEKKLSQASTDFRFAASVASFGMVLKDSEHKGRANFGSVLELAKEAKGDDKEGYRAEFINMVKKARDLRRDE